MEATARFDDRVRDYLLGRPAYPAAVVEVVRRRCRVGASARVADIGAGTGFLGGLFAAEGHEVEGVEPSEAMAEAGRRMWSEQPSASMRLGRAEATGLGDGSVDVVVVGQAFHWFDAPAVAREWARILRPGGGVALVWNRRRLSGGPFLEAYEGFLRTWGTDYDAVSESYESAAAMGAIFDPLPEPEVLPNRQVLDHPGLVARLRSCSYLPSRDHPRYPAMMDAIPPLFDRYAESDRVVLEYETVVFAGHSDQLEW
ncbi:MAG: class I SAM-dependent methyltransferase [Myxococcota bacterium]